MTANASHAGVTGNLTAYGDPGFSRMVRHAFFASMGLDRDDFDRPVVGIIDTRSDYTPCHRDMPAVIESVKRGVLQEGALPLVCPTLSLGETIISPTAMLYRNLLAMETEELMRAYPMDAVVLVGGCDKTLPAQLMAAASANVPAISVVVGPMHTGQWRGERLGACTDCRGLWMNYRAGEIDEQQIVEAESKLCPTGGTCMVMGTASTMACLGEALGIMLPGGATAPSGSGDRLRHAAAAGRCAAKLTRHPIYPRQILTVGAFRNAMTVLMALGGSTNAVIHLTAIARRAGIPITLDDFDQASRRTPRLVDCKPAGTGWLTDFHAAGGMPVLLKALEQQLDTTVRNVASTLLADQLATTPDPASWQKMIATLDNPLDNTESLVVLKGSLAPDGAIIKTSAANPSLRRHTGVAVVFESTEDVARRIDEPALKLTPDHVMVLRNAGPVGAGKPEAGSLPIPKYLAKQGVRDMVRVSDARMSGTAFGTVVLHCSPEAAVGGPLALVRDGDRIELDLDRRKIELLVDPNELKRRRQHFAAPPIPKRGWRRLFAEHVNQAHLGADLDILEYVEE